MTKLVRKLKQLVKKRAHRKAVQKRKAERAQKEIQDCERRKQEKVEMEIVAETANNGADNVAAAGDEAALDKKIVRFVGGLILDAPQRKKKKQLSRKQIKRIEKQRERGVAVAAQLERKWDRKKRRVKQRAQIRNEDLYN